MNMKDYEQKDQRLSRTIKDCQELSRYMKDYQGLSMPVIDCHGLSGTVMDFHGLCRLSWSTIKAKFYIFIRYWLIDRQTDLNLYLLSRNRDWKVFSLFNTIIIKLSENKQQSGVCRSGRSQWEQAKLTSNVEKLENFYTIFHWMGPLIHVWGFQKILELINLQVYMQMRFTFSVSSSGRTWIEMC